MAKEFTKYASILLDASIDRTLDYGVPAEFAATLCRGMRVEVPLRGRQEKGYVFEIKDQPNFTPVKPILSASSLIDKDLFELALWMARYYCTPLRQVLQVIVPTPLRGDLKAKEQLAVWRHKTREELSAHCIAIRHSHPAQAAVLDVMLQVHKEILLSDLLEKTRGSRSPIDTLAKQGWLKVAHVQVDRSSLNDEEYFPTKNKVLNAEQLSAFLAIENSINQKEFKTHLIFGVTGSGKTEIYLQAIEKALALGRGCIMLVPEIALTGQTIERFRSRFSEDIAILHHRLSQGERFDAWHKMQQGKAKIVIGARSAVFSPMPNLGLIIVDEEHESSYKQNEKAPCYHARDVAVMRGKLTSATVILGSATPSIESYHNAKNAKYELHTLSQRAAKAQMPQVKMIDMRKEYTKAQGYTNFSAELIDGIVKRKELGEQTILFLNKRGYHSSMQCQSCGQAVRCIQCAVSLTFHKGDNRLSCHLCGFEMAPPPRNCPSCKADHPLKFKGVGTELIEKALHHLVPDIRTLRIDTDTTKHKGSHSRLLREFGTGKADILIGTQMIAKGLHFPQVTLVAVLNGDAGLNFPDFRAAETTFQLITQVAGRAGRGSMLGEVLIQTCLPENETICSAASQDFLKFYADEIEVRQMFAYPPFAQMAKLCFSGTSEQETMRFAGLMWNCLRQQLPQAYDIHPVTAAGYAKIKNNYRFQFLVRGPKMYPISYAIEQSRHALPPPSHVAMLIDINPSSTFF